ncbi:helix-turn-helix domain-containing protein [Bacteriovorax sp. Seq25_V]|uniref:winged helix-turn-helix transcriptional regulator n=1 Tax=Bacteriovorax sp. Seq25_V TaxID=1201288 RepID=UPI00038A1754|nr:helix-turn-helix domain-containing protein [Bacteriovorax sp. Seq25_V]EQC44171.1 transcriptional regulator, HxlR family [Bacteriovorax sp. Seq25_V]
MENQEVADVKKKFDRGDVFSDKCPSREILKHITSKWGLLILLALSDGEIKRFSELRKTIHGVSEKMLAQTLKLLEEDKLVNRKSYDVVPPYVEYSLTELGLDLSKQVIGLTNWIEDNLMKLI